MPALPSPRPVAVAIAFALGLAAAPVVDRAGLPPSARWVVVLALGFTALRRRGWVLPAIVAAGTAHGAITAIDHPGVDDRTLDRLRGEVAGPVVRTARGWGARIGEVWVWSSEPIAAGEELEVTGRLQTPSGPRGPGLVDPDVTLRARGASLELSARSITRLADDPDPIARWWRWAAEVQRGWAAEIDAAGGAALGRAALRGIAVGDRTAIPPEVDARWRAAGIYHVLSVSGLHLAVVAGLLYVLLRRLLAGSPWGGWIRPARLAAPIALAIAIAYTAITGMQLATLRALIVVGVVFAGAMLDRPVRLADALAFAAFAILIWRPGDLFDPGFQLSFAAATTLAVRQHDRRGTGIRAWIARGLATSAWVTLATAPITAWHFHEVTVGGVLGNLILTPLVELVALPASLAGLAIGWDLPVWLSSELVGVVDRGAAELAELAPVGRIAIANPIVLVVLVAVSIGLAANRIPRVAGWLVLCVAWSLGRVPSPDGALRVTFVDVGQGDAAIVELPDDTVLLIDAGGFASAPDPEVGARPGRTIARVLAAYDRSRVDIAMISHPHPDHYLGLAGLDLPIDELWFAPEPEPRGQAFQTLADGLARRGTRVVHPPLGIAIARAGVEIEVLAPRYRPAAEAPDQLAADPVRSVNDNSLVIAIRFGGRTVLFTGDVEHEGEEALVAAGLGRVDVVKVAHHGSPTSSSAGFVAATRPTLAVISCGRNNQFGFPSPAVLARWHAAGAAIARTDVEGAIVLTIGLDGVLHVERFATPP